jgi:predicted esterase
MKRPSVVAITLALVPFVIGATFALRPWQERAKAEATVVAPQTEVAPAEAPADWCAPGYEPVAGGCLALPEGLASAPLIVYLHGRYARSAVAEEVDRHRRLQQRANRRGFAVLALRSELGLCSAAELTDWYCWPTSEAAANPGQVRRLSRIVDAAQHRVGATERYLLGFSSGGYYAGLLASRGWVPFDAVVVAHAGPVEPLRPLGPTPPMLLLSADDDVAQLEMMRLDGELTREGWPHDAYARAGAHGLADADIDAALTFFGRSGEAMPLRPPLALHRPAPHERDAGADEAGPDEAGLDEGDSGALVHAREPHAAQPAWPLLDGGAPPLADAGASDDAP